MLSIGNKTMDMTETQLSQVRRITITSKGSKFQKKEYTESNGSVEKGPGGQGRDEEKLLRMRRYRGKKKATAF